MSPLEQENALLKELLEDARSERDRLRKLFYDAGKGEYDVLALIDFYQQEALESLREVWRLKKRVCTMAEDLAKATSNALG